MNNNLLPITKMMTATIVAIGLSIVPSGSYGQVARPHLTATQESTEALLLRHLIEIQAELRRQTAELQTLRKSIDELKAARGSARTAPPRTVRPAATVTSLEIEDDDPVIGNANAPLILVEFSDFQCPYCGRFHKQTFPSLKQKYIDTGKLRYVLRDFPLGSHPEARMAAIAANCASEQGAYWPMKEKLFANQRRLGDALYQSLAVELTLDMSRYKTCLADGKKTREVEADISYGTSLGVRGTPTFFIGRLRDGKLVDAKRLVGAQPLAAFSRAIDALLPGH